MQFKAFSDLYAKRMLVVSFEVSAQPKKQTHIVLFIIKSLILFAFMRLY